MKRKILCVVGTRPEAIKMAPIILALKREPTLEVRMLATAQHRHLLDQVVTVLDIVPDIDLKIMRPKPGQIQVTDRARKEDAQTPASH